ncbi:MAG: hypothetical protein ACON30_08445 [Flavobacteriaceae bacterium]
MNKIIVTVIIVQSFCVAQTEELINTIYLDEVAVYNDSKKKYGKKYRTRGKQNSNISTSINSTFFTLIKKPPKGVIKSIKFFFNERKHLQTKDVKFDLLFVDTLDKETLRKKSTIKKYRFQISKMDKGEIELDISPLEIQIDNNFFIGIKRVDNFSDMAIDFSIDCNSRKGDIIYVNDAQNNLWYEIPNSNIKIELRVF